MRGQLLVRLAQEKTQKVSQSEYLTFVQSFGLPSVQCRVIASMMFEEQSPLASWVVMSIVTDRPVSTRQ